MSTLAQRSRVLELINEALAAGARLAKACEILGLAARTVQRWRRHGLEDRRPGAQRPPPANALSQDERERALEVLCSPPWADLSPMRILAKLIADSGHADRLARGRAG